MSNDTINQISIRIEAMLSEPSNSSTEQCIFKVHDRLRNHNKEAYEPQVLSIGPYHHGKCNFKKMETHKPRYLQELLLRRREKNAYRYIIALMELKDRARRCYAEEISLSEDDFVEMLCLDGIFIIEFLRKICMPELRNEGDEIFKMDWLISSIERDLILFENQIPFFVLAKLFDMTKLPDEKDNLINLALPVFEMPFDVDPNGSCTSNSANEIIHLLDLLHKSSCSSFDAILKETNDPKNDDELPHKSSCSCFDAILKETNDPKNDDDLLHKSWCSSFEAILKKIAGVDINDPENVFIKSVSQLRQSGIKFERATQQASWLHITFENGKIKIPRLTVDDSTESILRNLIAFEQYMTPPLSWKFVTDYATFLDDLINSPRDVEKLCHYEILTNWLGDDEVVATMFNKLVRDVSFNSKKFCYMEVYKKVNKHAGRRLNIWKAHSMRNYFNTPCSTISFLAAVVLLLLTAVSTIFSILAVISGK